MERTSGLPLELKATLHARSPTRTRSTAHQLIAGDALYAAPDTLPRSGFVHGREADLSDASGNFRLASTVTATLYWSECPLQHFDRPKPPVRSRPRLTRVEHEAPCSP